MASIDQIRGAILEAAVAHLLKLVGYRLLTEKDEGVHGGRSGLEIRGRGCSHQIDSIAAFDATPAFMYPLRLIVEAKCRGQKTGIDVVRNKVGVLKDISENYFTHSSTSREPEIQVQRFNYHGAIFSTSGFTSGAQRYAIAHQVFLIDYQNISVIAPLVEVVMAVRERHFSKAATRHPSVIKEYFEGLFENRRMTENPMLTAGQDIVEKVRDSVRRIKGSYFGTLQGRWPLHLLSAEPLPKEAFRATDTVMCRVFGHKSHSWSFVPIDKREGDAEWFRVDFNLPEEIANLVASVPTDPIVVANVKEKHFSYMTICGIIGGIRRTVNLVLDPEWIDLYKKKMQRKSRRVK